jgi:hypothetical protein
LKSLPTPGFLHRLLTRAENLKRLAPMFFAKRI